jgi:hypothetical protein
MIVLWVLPYYTTPLETLSVNSAYWQYYLIGICNNNCTDISITAVNIPRKAISGSKVEKKGFTNSSSVS